MSRIKHRTAKQVETDSKLFLESLVPGLVVEQPHIYNAFSPDLICKLSLLLSRPDIKDPGVECKAFKSFAASQIGLKINQSTSSFELTDKYKSIPGCNEILIELNNANKFDDFVAKYPKGSINITSISHKMCLKCVQKIYKSKGNRLFVVEDELGQLMTFPIESLGYYVKATARLRWHRSGSRNDFKGEGFVDDAFKQIFINQNKTYSIFREKKNRHTGKLSRHNYVYIQTDAVLNDVFRHVTDDTYEFKLVAGTNIWQIRLLPPAESTYPCLELLIKIVGRQRTNDLNAVKYFLNTGKMPQKRYKYKIRTCS